MTLKELYENVGGSYEQATNVLRIEKLIDKHIRKFPAGGVPESLIDAGKDMDPTRLFEAAHAMKGVCSNLGLVRLASLASEVCDDFRPGNARKYSDDEILSKIADFFSASANSSSLLNLLLKSACCDSSCIERPASSSTSSR